MPAQRDMFDPDPDPETDVSKPPEASSPREPSAEASIAAPLAAPCGFLDQRNQPCARLATKPICIDGVQFVSRGIPILHCHPACFRGATSLNAVDDRPPIDPPEVDPHTDLDRDPNDPGFDEAWASGDWERDDDDHYGA